MSHRVIAGHRSQYPDPIRFGPGDRLRIGRRDNEYPGWIRVTTPSGNEGWAPESIIRLETDAEGIALSEYDATELDTEVGQRVVRVRELCGWAWVENEHGESGWVPRESIAAQ
jgi:hypothetical protein